MTRNFVYNNKTFKRYRVTDLSIKKENTFANNAKKYPYSSHTEAREIEEINMKYTIFSLLILSVCLTSDVR